MPTPVVLVLPLDYVLRPAAHAEADVEGAAAAVSVVAAGAAATLAAVEAEAAQEAVEVHVDV